MPRGIKQTQAGPVLQMAAPEISEKIRERNSVHTLQWLGYRVMTTGKPVPVVCRNCRVHQFAQTTGSTPGLADVLVSHPRWPGQNWRMLETKKSDRAPRRKEQVELAEAGFSTFYVTEEQAVHAVIHTERQMGLEPNPRLLSWLEQNVKGAAPGTAALLENDTPNGAWKP